MILISLVFFAVGAVICAIANDFTFMLIGRSIQGVGGGGIISLSEVIITDLVPLRWRGQYFGILSAMWSLGSVTGPILGGGFSEKVSWVSRDLETRTSSVLIEAEVDFLYQLPFHWSWRSTGHSFPQAQARAQLVGREAQSNRLCWDGHFCRKHVLFFDPTELGWCLIRLGLMENVGTARRWCSRSVRFRLL